MLKQFETITKYILRPFDSTVFGPYQQIIFKMPISNVSPALTSIFDTIHRNMKTPIRSTAVPSIPGPILDINRYKALNKSASKISENKVSTVSPKTAGSTLKMRMKNSNTKKPATTQPPKPITNNKQLKPTNKQSYVKNKSLAQIKATLQQKTQQNMRRFEFDNSGKYNSQTQKRMREITRQKEILENILREHAKLKRDRETLANEMHMMKNYLDDIKGRLDDSVQKLNSSPILYERVMRPRRIILTKKQQNNYISKPGSTQRHIKLDSRLVN